MMREKTGDRRERTEDRGQRTEDRGQNIPSLTSRLSPLASVFLLLTSCFLLLISCNLYAAQFTAHFIDVGQGDCTFIQLPNGKSVLIDAGPADEYSDAGREIVVPYLNNLGIKSIDAVVVSHAHRDHIGGLLHVITEFPISVIYDSGYAHPSITYEKLLRTIKERNIEYVVAREGTKITLDPDVDIRVLGPPRSLPWDEANNNSIVLRIVYKNISFLLTGDAEAEAEDSLIRIHGYGLESNILKVGHHGSRSSSTDDFVYAVNPEIAIIQCGRRNRFGHPHRDVVRRFKDFGSEVYRNDLHGTIVIRTDGETHRIVKLGVR